MNKNAIKEFGIENYSELYECEHEEKYRTYQAAEEENGIQEAYYCENCDKDLDLPDEN